jgi:hypothetical protein
MRDGPDLHLPAEHVRYARILHWGTDLGLLGLVVSFLAYVSGAMPSHVPLARLPSLWHQSASSYLKQTGTRGWDWLPLVTQGDFASLGGIVFLAGYSIVCLLAVLPLYARRGDRVYVALCILEIVVLAVAASGLLTTRP